MWQSAQTTSTQVTFEPRKYLDDYFVDLNEEYEQLYRFWCLAVKAMSPGLRALELGVGPTLYSTIPLAERFQEIHLADYVEESLVEIRKWLGQEPDSFDWRPHIKLVLEKEGIIATAEEVAKREAKVRQAVTKLTTCDIRSQTPLGKDNEAYDLVSAHYCTEAATTNIQEWNEVIKNICCLIKPGGSLLLSVATELTLYRVYNSEVPAKPSPNITPELVQARLQDVGMNVKMEFLKAPFGRPYAGTILVFAQKLP